MTLYEEHSASQRKRGKAEREYNTKTEPAPIWDKGEISATSKELDSDSVSAVEESGTRSETGSETSLYRRWCLGPQPGAQINVLAWGARGGGESTI